MYAITNLNGKRSAPLTIDKFTTRSGDILAKDTFNADPTSIPGFDTDEQEHTSGLYGAGTRLDRRNAFTNIQAFALDSRKYIHYPQSQIMIILHCRSNTLA